MGSCRSCKTEVKPHQIYCPNCGIKHPLLSKEELKDFKIFKKKFKPVFLIILGITLTLFVLFTVKIPVVQTVPYNIKQLSPEIKPKENFLGCTEEEFRYSVNFVKLQVFAGVLQMKCNIENFENERGTFEYTAKIVNKLSLEEQQETSKLLLGPYENKTVSLHFKDVTSPDEVEPTFKVKPPLKETCKTETENIVIEKEKETIKTKQEKVYKSLFELILERIA